MKQRKSNAGRKPHDAALMFKLLVLQALYNAPYDLDHSMLTCHFANPFIGFST